MKKTYKIEVDCANCAAKMERAAAAVEGVKSASVNFMALKMNVEFKDGADVTATMERIRKECRRIERDCEIYF